MNARKVYLNYMSCILEKNGSFLTLYMYIFANVEKNLTPNKLRSIPIAVYVSVAPMTSYSIFLIDIFINNSTKAWTLRNYFWLQTFFCLYIGDRRAHPHRL